MTPVLNPPALAESQFTRVLGKLTCTISGEPISKSRARVTSRGTFTPKATKRYERTVATKLLQAALRERWTVGGWFSPDVQYAVEITFVVSSFAGDIDNKSKSILDAGNKILWPDDTRVVALVATKRRAADGEAPCAVVKAWAVTASERKSEDLARRPGRRISRTK